MLCLYEPSSITRQSFGACVLETLADSQYSLSVRWRERYVPWQRMIVWYQYINRWLSLIQTHVMERCSFWKDFGRTCTFSLLALLVRLNADMKIVAVWGMSWWPSGLGFRPCNWNVPGSSLTFFVYHKKAKHKWSETSKLVKAESFNAATLTHDFLYFL